MKPIIRGNRQLVDEASLRSTRKAASITSQFEIPLVTTLATTSDNSFTRIGGKFIDFTQFALVIEHRPKLEDILFHYSWVSRFRCRMDAKSHSRSSRRCTRTSTSGSSTGTCEHKKKSS